MPILGTAGLSKVINGPIPYAPDGNPLIGPMPGVPNAFEACVFTFGIAQAGGAGKVLAEWVTEGQTEWDMWSCDPRRFTAFAAEPDYCVAKGMEIYGHEYAIQLPAPCLAGRPRPQAVADPRPHRGARRAVQRLQWLGARHLVRASPATTSRRQSTQTFRRDGPWQQRIREECLAVRDAAGILDLPGFSRFRLQGAGARDWLSSHDHRRRAEARPHRPRLFRRRQGPHRHRNVDHGAGRGFLLPDHRSGRRVARLRVAAEASAARHAKSRWKTSPSASPARSCPGPKSRDILAEVTDADLSLPWLSHQSCQIAGRWLQLVRVSFAGELGWELHTKVEDTAAIFDAVWAAGQKHGLKPFGMFALDSLRLEKGYRAWKQDLSTDYTILQGGLERFVKWDKPDFRGKAALQNEKQQGVKKRFVTLVVEEPGDCDAPYMSTLWHDGEIVGETTVRRLGPPGGQIDRARHAARRPGGRRARRSRSRFSASASRRSCSRTSRCGTPRMRG